MLWLCKNCDTITKGEVCSACGAPKSGNEDKSIDAKISILFQMIISFCAMSRKISMKIYFFLLVVIFLFFTGGLIYGIGNLMFQNLK